MLVLKTVQKVLVEAIDLDQRFRNQLTTALGDEDCALRAYTAIRAIEMSVVWGETHLRRAFLQMLAADVIHNEELRVVRALCPILADLEVPHLEPLKAIEMMAEKVRKP